MGCRSSSLREGDHEEFSSFARSSLPRLSGRSHRPLTRNVARHKHHYDIVIQLKHEDKDIYACSFPSDDDGVLLSASKVEQTTFLRHNRDFSSIRLWDLNRRQINTGFLADFPRSGRSCDFSPDGQLVVSLFSEDALALVRMRSWRTTSSEVIQMRRIWRTRGSLLCCTFAPDGSSIVVVSRLTGDINHICVIDINSKKLVKKMNPALSSKFRGTIKSCIFSPDGLFLSISTSNGQLVVLDIQDLHIHGSLDLDNSTSMICLCGPFRHNSGHSLTLAMQCWYLFDPRYGHKYLSSCLEDGTIQTWMIETEKPGLRCIQSTYILQTPWQKLCSAAFSPDGAVLAIGTSDSKILGLNSESLTVMFTLNAYLQPDGLRTWYQNTEVSCLAFTRTCQQLAAGYNDGRIRVWMLPLIMNLQHMCRLSIIKHIPANQIPHLPLPTHLLRYLLYSPIKYV
ncbi:uncharacterized WD repeat-containing protein alr3466 isoform X2 [Nematostella vectensis]|uniref:uncharacterized WD repeat-containing protein alr3466 isoform X1 n=1 Tax=Nematostella vectensis TaxID=45351 RepID=UPI002077908F|nr:uncharacterized WD repeat-containing protein alr3466 isoform X1 [Nematostella vectensis]XP_048584309.1 uncharacterized WD repeat-containing protein alr3466 isoform X2 [Nematostella vectensis]